MEDQEVVYKLALLAKDRDAIPGLYEMVRNYRAQMTRLKLAYEMDMGIGYTAVPTPTYGPPPRTGHKSPQFKLRYGLKHTTSIVGQEDQPTTPRIYDARRTAAREFKSVVGKNEVVIAIRQHAGAFPVYAVRRGNRLLCYNITAAKLMQRTGYEITKEGKLV